MDTQKRTWLFAESPIPQAVLSLCLPTVLNATVSVLYNLADTWFVGMINDPVQSAAITLSAPMMMLYNAVTALFGVGCSSLMSRKIGAGEEAAARRTAAMGIWLSLLFGLLFSVLYGSLPELFHGLLGAGGQNLSYTAAYLRWTVMLGAAPSILNLTMAYLVRAEGASLAASIGTMSGCFLNILLDPIFISPRGLNLGAEGAGLATCLSNCAACGYFLVYLAVNRRKTLVSLSPRHARPDRALLRGILTVGVPAMIANLLTVASQIVLTHLTANYGSDAATAAMGIAFRIDLIPSNICHGLSAGILPLVGYNFASGDHRRMRAAVLYVFRLSLTIICAVTGLYLLFADTLISWFIPNAEVIAFGARFLRGLCIALPFYCVDFVTAGVFQACGLGKHSLAIPILRNAVLEIPAFFLLNRLFSVFGLPYAYLIAEGILSVALVWMLRRIPAWRAPAARPAASPVPKCCIAEND